MTVADRRRRLGAAAALLLVACSGQPSLAPAVGSPAAVASASPASQLGPGGLTLDEEVGAVIMVGFRGPLTEVVLDDWRRHQYGGLLIVNLNHNAGTPAAMSDLVARIRSAGQHRLIAATDQEGGGVCIALSSVPCDPMPAGRDSSARMAAAIRSLGFDLDLGPVADVCSGTSSIMWGRCYGTDPGQVAAAVGPVVDGIHAGGMLAAAKHFPGHGGTSVSSETDLPRIDESLETLSARDWPPFRAAIGRGVEFVLLGHLLYPSLDGSRSADLSPATIAHLRGDLGFRGAVISDDMQMGAITSTTSAPEAAVDFLLAGGDMVMIAHDLPVAAATYDAIRSAVVSGRLSRGRLDEAVSALQALPRR